MLIFCKVINSSESFYMELSDIPRLGDILAVQAMEFKVTKVVRMMKERRVLDHIPVYTILGSTLEVENIRS